MADCTVAAGCRRDGGHTIEDETRDSPAAPAAALSWVTRVAVVLIALAAAVAGSGYARAASGPAANIDQCRNGTFADPGACTGSAWQNGNLGGENSHYREGQSVPFRLTLDNLSVGDTYTVSIEYDTVEGGKHSYDYLTSFNATETTADPTSGISGLTPGNCFPIPVDPNVIDQEPGCITIWNGAITSVAYGGDST